MKHKAAAARKFRNAIRIARRHMPENLPAGFFLTDPARTPDLLETVGNLPPDIGVVFRHFGERAQLNSAASLGRLCSAQGRVLLVSADRVLSDEIGASGVHWPARLARNAGTGARLNTMSVHDTGELRLAIRLGMDAVFVSTAFASGSPSAGAPMGLSRLARFRKQGGPAVYALGGIEAKNCELTARIAGFAAVSGLEKVFGPRT